MLFIYSILIFVAVIVGLSIILIFAERVLVNYGECKIDINSGGKELEVQGGQSLLSAFYSNKVFIPSACGGKGSCGFCKVTVKSGGGPVLPTELPYLSRKELKTDVRLACQVKVREDVVVTMPEEYLSVQEFTAEVISTISLTQDMKEIRFKLIEPEILNQRAGQYIQMECPSDDGPVYRAYSIASPPSEPNIVEIIVRLVPDGIGSTYLHNLNVGDTVTLTGPYGEFVLNEDPDVAMVCVGGGAGMAPMKNIIYTIYEKWPDRKCTLYFGCRNTYDTIYLDMFKEFKAVHPAFDYVYALSSPLGPEEKWDGETGFIHIAVDKCMTDGDNSTAFLCGPPLMIDAVTKTLKTKGLADDDIFFDDFGG